MNALGVVFWILKIIGAIASIGLTYVQYRDYKKKQKEKGSPDAGTSDKPDDDDCQPVNSMVEAAEPCCLFFNFIVTSSMVEVKFSCIINSMLDFFPIF